MAETVVWIDPDDVTVDLDVKFDVRGRFAPPVEFEEDGVPGQPGKQRRAARHGVKDFVLPFWVHADTAAELRTALRELVYRMDPVRGPGRIRITSPAGDQREIECSVADGMGLDEVLGESSTLTDQKVVPVFRAHMPYWQATSDTVLTFEGGETATFFPFFPLRLSSSQVFADTTVTNTGDIETWPVWTVSGPASAITLRNLTTGKILILNTTLVADETVTIDTRPGHKTVLRGDGSNAFTNLTTTSSLWPLVKGANAIRVEMASTTEVSWLRMARRTRYLAA